MTQSGRTLGRTASLALGASTLALGLLAGCSGSDDAGGQIGTAAGPFALNEVSVSTGQIWQVNRPVRLTFSTAVDFDTVNLNTISIQQVGGLPAIGDFMSDPNDARVVIFQPVCPTEDDFSDAGFRPGGNAYRIDVPTSANASTTVRSTGGNALSSSFPVTFTTPDTTVPSDLFLDPQPGPVSPVVQAGVGTSLVTGGEGGMEAFFQINSSGNGELPGGMLVPNNFYSAVETQVFVNLRLDQPVSPRAENISSDRLRLQFLNPSLNWQDLNADITLLENCAGTGATIRMEPVGILPQGSDLRVVITPQFEDLVGERNTTPLDRFALMTTDAATDGAMNPVETADEFLENYLDTDFEDTQAALSAPRADWGPDGLRAAFDFDGNGGPNGEFDLFIAPNQDVVFDTTSTLFFGGPGGLPQFSQLAVNGRLDVRDLFIPASSSLRISGPNVATIFATGDVRVEGELAVNGGNAKSVFTLNTPTQPETGAAGNGGGGAGGTGSFLVNQVTPRGGNGFGAFGTPNGGGVGGEAGYGSGSDTNRRPGGGGGGVLGHDQMVRFNMEACKEQTQIGLDAESGFSGHVMALSSQGPHFPYGGPVGPSPFGALPGDENDFFGTMVANVGTANEMVINGELPGAIPGTGGGAGGDSTRLTSGTYPPPTLVNNDQDKGAGGGGGGGALTILALGDIIVGPSGKISARGGHGNGGENTGGVNRIGGGSGGGSGGYIVLQTAGRLDLSNATPTLAALDARGGQGGDGAGGQGGAFEGESTPAQDSLHRGATLSTANNPDNPFDSLTEVCQDYYISLFPSPRWNIVCAGGDGGPGIIQVHVGDLSTDILYPGNEGQLAVMSTPAPIGYDRFTSTWQSQLLPVFGRFSQAQSRWIPLGEATITPGSPTLGDVAFLFDGTDGGGLIESTTGTVDALDEILSEGSLTLDMGDPTSRTALLDATPLLGGSDVIYTRNPALLRRFRLTVGGFPYDVASASYDETGMTLSVTVAADGPDLSGAAGAVELLPRYFRVTTNGIEDALPSSASVQIEFELAQEDPGNPGLPDSMATTGFLNDPTGALPGVDESLIRYMRYRVTFDITQGTGDLDFTTPLPTLDFLRLPFVF